MSQLDLEGIVLGVTSVRIHDDLKKRLEKVSKKLRHSKGWVMNEALREYLDHQDLEERRWEETLEALEDIEAGRVVDGKKVMTWLKSWGKEDESPPPGK